jgi:hypothetical protein
MLSNNNVEQKNLKKNNLPGARDTATSQAPIGEATHQAL